MPRPALLLVPTLTLLAACGDSDPADPAADAPAAPAPGDPAAAAPATPATGADGAAVNPPGNDEPALAPDPNANGGSAAPIATAQSPSHCAEGQHIWFECAVGQGRTVSLCGNGDPSWLQYHFGPPGKPALSVPAAPTDTSLFHFATGTWPESKAHAIRFDNGGVTYLLVDRFAQGPAGAGSAPADNFQGVVVRQGTAEISRFPCTGQFDGTAMATLEGKLSALGYTD